VNNDRENLQAQFSRLLHWERRKRREAVLVSALFYALVGALGALPFLYLAGHWAWSAPLAFFAALAPYFLFARRWRGPDTTRALAALDKSLGLHERATTAWELLQRGEASAVALLVLRQAEARLKSLDPRALFPRTWSWQGYLVAPLFALWLVLLWYDGGQRSDPGTAAAPTALAEKLREFARSLQDKAQSENLPQTLKAARELEKMAQKGVDARTADESFKNDLADMARKMASERKTGAQAPFDATSSRQDLEDLRAELEAARDLVDPADGAGQSWQDRLSASTQLKKQLDRQSPGGQSGSELKNYLDKLEKQVAGELDRRALLEAEQYLQQMAQRGQSQPGETQARAGGKEEERPGRDGEREREAGTAPGDEPGKNPEKLPSLPEFQGGARAQVKGTIGEGERSGLFFKAKPAPGKSRLSQDEVIASYRRQAEAELNTEKIPDELKDTIKNYFLSLEKTK
jgi:hypothetical protein